MGEFFKKKQQSLEELYSLPSAAVPVAAAAVAAAAVAAG